MGRKKKKQAKPWCWYCNREFDEEKILLQHQKAKHFKCHVCHRRLYTGPGLAVHCMQVHKEKVDRVPNSLPGRNNIEIEIYGMEGIPEEDLREHERQKAGKGGGAEGGVPEDDEPKAKMAKTEKPPLPPGSAPPPPGMMGGMMPGNFNRMPMPPTTMPPGGPMGMPPGMGPMGPMGPMPPMGPMGPMGPMPPMGHMGGHGPMRGPMPPMGGPMGGPPAQRFSAGGPMMNPGGPGGHMGGPPRHMGPPSSGPGPSTSSGPNAPLFPAAANRPNAPLFPAAANVTSSGPSPVGPDFRPKPSMAGPSAPPPTSNPIGPVRPTFPAYSAPPTTTASYSAASSATISAAPTVRKPESSSGLTIKLVHPDEDISLEERRASLPKYKVMTQQSHRGPPMPPMSGGGMGMQGGPMQRQQMMGGPGGPMGYGMMPPRGPPMQMQGQRY